MYIAGVPVWTIAVVLVVAGLLALYLMAKRPARAAHPAHYALMRDIDQLVIPERMANPDTRPGSAARRPLFAR